MWATRGIALHLRSFRRHTVDGWIGGSHSGARFLVVPSQPMEDADASQSQPLSTSSINDEFLRWARKDIAQRHTGMVELPSAVEKAVELAVKAVPGTSKQLRQTGQVLKNNYRSQGPKFSKKGLF